MLSPDAKPVRAYYATLARYAEVGAAHEGAVQTAFHEVLQAAAGSEWTLVPEFSTKGTTGRSVRYDGALRDSFRYTLGFWEAKDTADDLDREIQRKVERGYSLQNTIFQAPHRAVLYQDDRVALDVDLREPARLVEVLGTFLDYQAPRIAEFRQAVREFKTVIPDLAGGLLEKIESARATDPAFRAAFEGFVETVRESVNPTIAPGAVQEMLIQHLLTERVVRTVFGNRDFARRNAIAREIETVIDALTARHMSREQFIGRLDRFYRAIEETADTIADWSAKQDFLNTVYEQFFQGFSARVADTHGIVYTPQPLVDFMVRSVDALLQRHFGQTLAEPGVHVLDPFVGTGNFLVRVIEQIPAPSLPQKYGVGGAPGELHANEVMLLPYYVASLNVEHAYREKTGSYAPFQGIVLVDTFEMVEGKSIGMFSAENSERAQRQRESPIKVILGNPPYNAHQVNANDANQNRKYPLVDGRVSETYAAASAAQNKNALSDPYVKAFRWASDRLSVREKRDGEPYLVEKRGIVSFVTNDSFLDGLAFDGMRRKLAEEFDEVWVVGLGGNVRKDPTLSGTTHNVFGIQVGVAVTFLVRREERVRKAAEKYREFAPAVIRYAEAGARWRKEEKYDWLEAASERLAAERGGAAPPDPPPDAPATAVGLSPSKGDSSGTGGGPRRGADPAGLGGLEWRELTPNRRHVWLTGDLSDEWEDLMPVASSDERQSDELNETTIFTEYGRGVETSRDVWVYDFDRARLGERVEQFVDTYNAQVVKWERKKGRPGARVEDVVTHDDTKIKWNRQLRNHLKNGRFADFDADAARIAEYRPFLAKWLYLERPLVYLPGGWPEYMPTPSANNLAICATGKGSEKPFTTFAVNRPPDLNFFGGGNVPQWFPLYTYRPLEDGTEAGEGETEVELDGVRYARKENLTDWALEQFRDRYGDASITKEDVFHYVYAVLHHPAYRARYAADLKRSLPRIPFAPVFHPFAEAGGVLASLHVGYETGPEYPLVLEHVEGRPLTYRVEKMKLDEDAGTLRLNASLALSGIPEAAHRYRLGNRSALGWLVDQLRVKADRRSGIVHDPNAAFAGDEIVGLVRRVTQVSVETVRVVEGLPGLGLPEG
ncbi:MAG: type ISP restriction/modification enzyme [Bacteroidota bacterium]